MIRKHRVLKIIYLNILLLPISTRFYELLGSMYRDCTVLLVIIIFLRNIFQKEDVKCKDINIREYHKSFFSI